MRRTKHDRPYRPAGRCLDCGSPCSTAYCDRCVPVRVRNSIEEREIYMRELNQNANKKSRTFRGKG